MRFAIVISSMVLLLCVLIGVARADAPPLDTAADAIELGQYSAARVPVPYVSPIPASWRVKAGLCAMILMIFGPVSLVLILQVKNFLLFGSSSYDR